MAEALRKEFGDQIAVQGNEDPGKTGNFEVVAWPNGQGQDNDGSVALHLKNGRGDGHVNTDEKLAAIVRQIKPLLT